MRHALCALCILSAISLASNDCYGLLFKYVDADGTLVVTDSLPPSWTDASTGESSSRFYEYIDEDGILVISRKPEAAVPRGGELPADYRDMLPYREVEYEFYRVGGATYEEILTNMQRQGPYDKNAGRRVSGLTQWKLRWSFSSGYSYSFDHDRKILRVNVELSDVRLDSEIKVSLPALADGTSLSDHDAELWRGMARTVAEHETDHVRIIREGISEGEFARKLGGLRLLEIPYESGGGIDRTINDAIHAEVAAVGTELFTRVKLANEHYDELTRHGRSHESRARFFAH